MKTLISTKKLLAVATIILSPFFLNAQNKIVFSSKPFPKGGTAQKEFVWNTPIYAKITIDKPLKNYAKKIDDYDMEQLHVSGIYSSYISLYCIPVGEDINSRSNVEIKLYLTDSELAKNEISIDLMPAEKDASTFYGTGFSRELANTNVVEYNAETGNSVGKNTEFRVFLFEDLPSVSHVEYGEQKDKIILYSGIYNILGSLFINYTSVTESRDVADWKDRCINITESINSKYKTDNKVRTENETETENETNPIVTNIATDDIQSNLVAQNKMIFSSRPFSQGGTEQKEFKANTTIYARIVLEKPLKSYCKSPSKKMDNVPTGYARQFCVMPTNRNEELEVAFDEILSMNYIIHLTFSDLENSYIDFDLMPSNEDATTVYSDWTAFYWSFASPDLEIGKKSHFAIKVYSEYNQSNAEITGLSSFADFYIDYSGSTEETQKKWYEQCKTASENARANGLKIVSKNAGIEAAKLPLPSCFSKGNNPGYKNPENSVAKITALIKQKYGITEVFKLTFDKADGVEDYRTLVDANTNEPTCKMGNHVFYFAFKDKDGSYRFTGGVLRKDHIGYGKFGETYIQNYSPMQGEEKYPLDVVRDGQGIYGVFYFDGSKLK